MSGLHFAAVNAEGIVADLDLLPAAYRVLLKLRAHSEPGGRIEIDQVTIAQMLGLSRAAVNAAMRDLDLAQLVKKQRAGVYQLHPMLAAYLSPEDAVAAVKTMPKNERLNSPASSTATRGPSPPTRTSSPRNAARRKTPSAARPSKPSPDSPG